MRFLVFLLVAASCAPRREGAEDANPLHIKLLYFRDKVLSTQVQVGTPPVTLTLEIDTVGADSVVIDRECVLSDHATSCAYDKANDYARNTYSPANSTTSSSLGFGYTWGDDTIMAKADAVSDVMAIAGYQVPGVLKFGTAKVLEDDWTKVLADGVLSLGLKRGTNLGDSIIKNLSLAYPSNTRTPQLVTLWLDDFAQPNGKGYLTIGDYDARNCDVDSLIDVTMSSGVAWEFVVSSWQFGNQVGGKSSVVRLDSTSRRLLFPSAQLTYVAKAVGAIYDYDIKGYYVPCEKVVSLPDFVIAMNGVSFQIAPIEYAESYNGTDKCELLFNVNSQWELWHSGPQIRLGHPFLRAYCTFFDFDGPALQFARAHHFQ